ncbi:MAG: ABC transporter ATP-binding protein [Acidobacteria bacterium]|nr:ABC transporter ATP-binding protein [Acidobacteriota bacterium]
MSAVEVNNLSKLYFLGERKSNSLREVLAGFGRSGARRELWALRDVSFKVEAGETLGIIGRNGAGKSTLLKILSRVTKPTSGTASLSGRVGSLLEVGTGFHNELSGRDNIFLNGAILGMKRTEIARKFDEIVSFAEIEAFLDTPVKHYSSGMYMRLAFAIAAHLDTEILIVDEVLAVGDAEFQKKCLGKMQDIRESGRTVLFVSHDMAAITRVCSRAIAFNKGEIVDRGESAEVVRSYLTATWRVDSEKDF